MGGERLLYRYYRDVSKSETKRWIHNIVELFVNKSQTFIIYILIIYLNIYFSQFKCLIFYSFHFITTFYIPHFTYTIKRSSKNCQNIQQSLHNTIPIFQNTSLTFYTTTAYLNINFDSFQQFIYISNFNYKSSLWHCSIMISSFIIKRGRVSGTSEFLKSYKSIRTSLDFIPWNWNDWSLQ